MIPGNQTKAFVFARLAHYIYIPIPCKSILIENAALTINQKNRGPIWNLEFPDACSNYTCVFRWGTGTLLKYYYWHFNVCSGNAAGTLKLQYYSLFLRMNLK